MAMERDRRSIIAGAAVGSAAAFLSIGALCGRAAGQPNAPAKSGRPVNVKDFGAAGDGHADDTSAFKSAFDVLNARKGTHLVVPFGQYRLTSGLTVSKPDCIIEGENSVLHFDQGQYAQVAVDGNGSVSPMLHINARNCSVSLLKISGKEANADCGLLAYPTDTASLPAERTWGRIVIDRVELSDQPGNGLMLVRAEHARILQTWAVECGGVPLIMDRCAWAYLENFRAMHGASTGIRLQNCLYTVAINVESLRNQGQQLAILGCRNTRFIEPDIEIADSTYREPRGVLVSRSHNTDLQGGDFSHLGPILLLTASTRTNVTWPVVFQTKVAANLAEPPLTGVARRDMKIVSDGVAGAFLRRAAPQYTTDTPALVVADPASNGSLSVQIEDVYMRGYSQKVSTT